MPKISGFFLLTPPQAIPQADTAPSVPEAGEQKARWNVLRRQVAIRLAPYFGPDLMTTLAPLMKADTHKALRPPCMRSRSSSPCTRATK